MTRRRAYFGGSFAPLFLNCKLEIVLPAVGDESFEGLDGLRKERVCTQTVTVKKIRSQIERRVVHCKSKDKRSPCMQGTCE